MGAQKRHQEWKGCQVGCWGSFIRGARKVNVVSWMKMKFPLTKMDESGNDFIDNLHHHGLLIFGN